MHELEKTPSATKQLDVVPISGLVVNVFARIETELRTALELWGPNGVMRQNSKPARKISIRGRRKNKEDDASQSASSPSAAPSVSRSEGVHDLQHTLMSKSAISVELLPQFSLRGLSHFGSAGARATKSEQ
jgi:hypothetical protein